jgi:hypothetical protein
MSAGAPALAVAERQGRRCSVLAAARSPAPPQGPRRRRPAVGFGRMGLQTTPGRIRALAAVVVLTIAGFYIVASIAVGNARDGR